MVAVPAPVHGLVFSAAVAKSDPLGAEALENWFPTQRGIRVRGGASVAATTAEATTAFMSYDSGGVKKLFAADAHTIYQVDSLAGGPATVAITGLTAGDWIGQQIETAGGDYLLIFNGSDTGWIYDGTNWNPLADQAINDVPYATLTGSWAVGDTVTGGTSGASAVILGITPLSLKVGTITAGPFTSGETITATGASATTTGASAAASAITLVGVASSDLVAPWLFGNRLFAIEAGTLNSWYWPTDSVGGTLESASMAGVVQRGGDLMFGCAWSADAGAADGIRYFDHCVFMTNEGEIATYRGSYSATDPATAGDWILAGRYDIAVPLGRKCHMKAGGDVAIATRAGVVPMSAITSKDPAALAMSAVSHPIDPLWNRLFSGLSSGVEMVKWTDNAMALINCPGTTEILSVNLQTGAWAEQKGWDASCLVVFDGQAYMGRSDGKILALDESGTDDGLPFVARYCHSFLDIGSAAQIKIAGMARTTFFSGSAFISEVGVATDYTVSFPDPPAQTSIDLSDYMVWDVSNWDEKLWWDLSIDAALITEVTQWQSVSAAGNVMAPTVQITSGGASRLNLELTRTDLAVQTGGFIV